MKKHEDTNVFKRTATIIGLKAEIVTESDDMQYVENCRCLADEINAVYSKVVSPFCEEASQFSKEFFIPCGRPSKYVVTHNRKGEKPYAMCEMCADHNVKNRGAEIIMQVTQS